VEYTLAVPTYRTTGSFRHHIAIIMAA
jgi:hypothetical protein